VRSTSEVEGGDVIWEVSKGGIQKQIELEGVEVNDDNTGDTVPWGRKKGVEGR